MNNFLTLFKKLFPAHIQHNENFVVAIYYNNLDIDYFYNNKIMFTMRLRRWVSFGSFDITYERLIKIRELKDLLELDF